jgi:homoaconitase/3-isopropylmalate dehydratase large subunit
MSATRCEGVFGAFDHGKGEIDDKHILAVQQTSKKTIKKEGSIIPIPTFSKRRKRNRLF